MFRMVLMTFIQGHLFICISVTSKEGMRGFIYLYISICVDRYFV